MKDPYIPQDDELESALNEIKLAVKLLDKASDRLKSLTHATLPEVVRQEAIGLVFMASTHAEKAEELLDNDS